MSLTESRGSGMRSYVKGRRVYLTLLAGPIAIFLLVAYAGFGATWREVEHLNPFIFVGVFAFSVIGSLIAAGRLRTLLRIHGHEVAYPDVYHINVVGVLGNELTPGVHLGGEVLRIFLLGKHGVRTTSAVTCALVVKILDVLIIFPLAILLASLIVLHLLSVPTLLAVMAFVFLLCLSTIILLISRGYVYRGVRRILSRIGIREAPAKFHFSKRMGASLVSMSYARWLVFGLLEYMVIRALGIDLGLTSVLAIFTVGTVVRLIAPMPFGLGVTEAITAGLYFHFGATLSEATAAALVTRTCVTLMIVILGAYGGLRIGFNAIRRVAGKRFQVSRGKHEVG